MGTDIAIITTEFLRDYVDKAIRQLPLAGNCSMYPYSSFSEIAEIYRGIPAHTRGVLVSGAFPQRTLQVEFPKTTRVILPILNDDAGVYKLFFSLLNAVRGLDLSRVYADILDVAGLGVEEFLLGDNKALADMHTEATQNLDIDQLFKVEDRYAQRHMALWREQKIDISITRFSSIMGRLQDAGLNVRFAYPSQLYIQHVYTQAVQQVALLGMRENQPAVIMASLRGGGAQPSTALKTLRQAVGRFKTVMQVDLLLHDCPQGLEMITSWEVVERLTEKRSLCLLRDFLDKRLDFAVNIGYGMGRSLHQARANATDAVAEAFALSKDEGVSAVIDENDVLIAPLRLHRQVVVPRRYPEAVRGIAAAAGLSALTVQKVLFAFSQHQGQALTADDLAYKLSVSKRSASRFLEALKNSETLLAEQQRTATKGRPKLLYRLNESSAMLRQWRSLPPYRAE